LAARFHRIGKAVNLPGHWSVSVVNERNWPSGADEMAAGPDAQEATSPLPRRLPRRRPPASRVASDRVGDRPAGAERPDGDAPAVTTDPEGARQRDDDVVVTWAGGASAGLAGTILTGEHVFGPIPAAPPTAPPGIPADATSPWGMPAIVIDEPPAAPAAKADKPPAGPPTKPPQWPAVTTTGASRSEPVIDLTRITSEHPALTAQPGPGTVAMATAEHVALAVAGDAFDTFYRSEKPRVVAVVSSLTGDRAAAEDIVQEAFATAMRRWATVSGYERPGDWVKRVAVNRAISRFRRRQSETRALTRFAGTDDDTTFSNEREPWEDDPLWAAVRKLPRRQAQAVVLVYVDDLSLDRVAEILECSVGSVKTHLHRARQRLAVELGTPPAPEA
jgi:RNA polymerase sigma-70 factor (ECF subfamily)